MDERFTIHDLVKLLAERYNMKQEDAYAFVDSFFLLVKEALEYDKYVKIKGLGTFKLIDVDKRESININTGERIEVQSHSRIVFVPDSVMRNVVNKPFSHFEAVVLNDGVEFDDMPEGIDVNEEAEADGPVVEDHVVLDGSCEKKEENLSDRKVTDAFPSLIEQKSDFVGNKPSDKNLSGSYGIKFLVLMVVLALGVVVGGIFMWLAFMSSQTAPNKRYPEEVQNAHWADSVNARDVKTYIVEPDSIDTLNVQPVTGKEKSVIGDGKETEILSDSIGYEIVGTMVSHEIRMGESLVRLSSKYYGNKKLWPYIAKYNRALLDDVDNVPIGTVIQIPKLSPMRVK